MGGQPSKPDHSRSMEVIGAGISRTGTLSMQLALERLLDGPVLHGGTQALMREDAYAKEWVQVFQAKHAGDEERMFKLLREVTAGFVACTDVPPDILIPELVELYPEAKVVLVTRDPQKWWASAQALLSNALAGYLPYICVIAPTLRWFPLLTAEWELEMNRLLGGTKEKPAKYGPELILAHNKHIMHTVPKERLLIMDLKEGWEPLCKFLGKPIPDEPFPHVNDKEASDKVAKRLVAEVLLMWFRLFSILGGSIYLLYLLLRLRQRY